MGAIIQGAGTSELRWNAQRLEISLSRQVFGEMWDTVVARLIDAWGSRSFFTWTQPTMTVRGKGADAPRWKVHPLDVLSGLFFLLKVPANHELVRLWAVIDWSAINALCATPYHNAHGGPHAWAPAQMVALLVLMFLHGVPHETTLLCRVRENIVWCWFCGFGLFGPWPDHSTLYTFRQRLGVELFECVLTIAVQACIEAGLVANELIHFDLTAVVASGHRWSPYERAVLLSKALIRYLEQIWADQMPEEPFPEALRMLAAEVALESLPHKRLQEVAPERVAQSVADWDGQTNPEQTAWQTTLEEAVQEELATTDEPFVQDMSTQAVVTWLSRVAKHILERLSHTRGDQDARVGRTGPHDQLHLVLWLPAGLCRRRLAPRHHRCGLGGRQRQASHALAPGAGAAPPARAGQAQGGRDGQCVRPSRCVCLPGCSRHRGPHRQPGAYQAARRWVWHR
jgi:transposase